MSYFGEGYRRERRIRAGKYVGATTAIVGLIVWGLVALISQPYCRSHEDWGYKSCTQQVSPFETRHWKEPLNGAS